MALENEPTDDTDGDADDEDIMTSNTKMRVKYLASLMAGTIQVWWMVMFYLLVTGQAQLTALPDWPVFVTVMMVLGAASWTFGIDFVSKWLDTRK